ncbi:MAG: M15 family metallopeptidase [Candidatus Ozemobacteraceae bacterium]
MKRWFSWFVFVGCLFCSLFPSVVIAASETAFLCVTDIEPLLLTDVRYATPNNFTGKIVYESDKVLLREPVAKQLAKAARYLKETYGFQFKIFDGYRPLAIQKKFWAILPDPKFVADPKVGSRHNRGAAVDLTIVDASGKEFEMGTPFDDFTPRAAFGYKELSESVRLNRHLLASVMKKFGFDVLPSEWWHFDYHGWKAFSVADFPVK